MTHHSVVKQAMLFGALCLLFAMGAAMAQQRFSIEYPREGEQVRGLITVRLKRDIQQGYFVVKLDGNFHSIVGEDSFILNTVELPNGDHAIEVEFHDASGQIVGNTRVTFRVANGIVADNAGRFLFRHWNYDDYAKRVVARYRQWIESNAVATIKSKPGAAGGGGAPGGGGMPGMPGGGMGMPGMPGMGGMGPGMPGMGGMGPGMPGMGGGPGMPPGMGSGGESGGMGMGMPGMGGGMGGGMVQPPDTSALDKQLSFLLRQEIRDVLVTGAANIRTIVQYAFERGRESAQGGGMGGSMDMGMPGGMGMMGMGPGRGGGMPGMGGGASMPPGVKPKWSEQWFEAREANKQQVRMIFPTGIDINATANSGPQDGRRHFKIPTFDILPRFPVQPTNDREPRAIPEGESWSSPMTFVVELVHRIALRANGTIQFTKFEDVQLREGETRRCAKLEAVLKFKAPPGRLVLRCGNCKRPVPLNVGPGEPCPNNCGAIFTDEIMGSANPAIIAAGFTSQFVGGGGGGGSMMGSGGAMGGEEGMSGMAGGGMRGGMPGMPGGGMGMPGMGGGMSGGGSSAESGPDIRNAETTINRTLYFDPLDRKIILAVDDIMTEYDIMGGSGGGGMGMGGMPGAGGMPGGGMGMPGGGMGPGGGMPGMGGGGSTEQWTHVVYRVKITTWLDTEPVKASVKFGTRKDDRPNPHDYDSVKEEGKDRSISHTDPKNPFRNKSK